MNEELKTLSKVKQESFDSVFNSLLHSQNLWNAFNTSQLVSCFSNILKSSFACIKFDFFYLYPKKTGDIDISPHYLRYQDLPNISASILHLLKKQIKEKGVNSKLNRLDNTQEIFLFIFLSESNRNNYLCCWSLKHEDKIDLLSLVVKQMMYQNIWLNKIARSLDLIYCDDLTKLSNYRYLKIFIEQEIKRAKRFNNCFSILFIDIDHLKEINDKYGHLVGSKIIQDVSCTLRSSVRDIDCVARYGGDEFVIVLVEASTQIAHKVANRILDKIRKKIFTFKNLQIKKTISIGVSSYTSCEDTFEILLEHADKAMYESKKKGRNQVSINKLQDKK